MTDTPFLRALSAAVGAADAPDSELLRRFAEDGDRAAFELVVRRHAELVWGVCRAALPGDPHAAEDAFQAAFLVLARKAGAVRGESAAGWLFRVARNAAVRARGRAARRAAAPLPDALAAPGESAEDAAVRREAAPVVAEEVARLAARLREPVVLCLFEGHTHTEAAERLGWPVGTVASRLARAKDVLRARLTRRGVAVPAAGLGAVFAPTATAAPAVLVRSAVATGPSGHASPAVLSLTEGVLSAMRFEKLKVFAACAAVALGLTAALAAVPGPAPADPAPNAPNGAALVAVPAGAAARPAPAADDKAAQEQEAREKELEAKELKALQGKWRVVKIEVDGKELLPEDIAKIQFTIKDNEIEQTTAGVDQPEKMKIALKPGASPKEIDLTPLTGPEDFKGKTAPGIYKLTDDTLTMCGAKFDQRDKGRPKEFKADDGVSLIVLERIKDEKEELAALAGEWKTVKVTASGKEIPAEQLEKGKWVIKGAEITVSDPSEAEEKAALKIDPTAVPPTIDVTPSEGEPGKGIVMKGIYFRQGDKLTIAFRDPGSQKDDRPKELKADDDVAFVVLERTPKK
jgi:RNA polymerase sigma factor (sigma-70 family)